MPRKYVHRPDFKSRATDIHVLRAREIVRRPERLARLKVEDPAEYQRRLDVRRAREKNRRRKRSDKPIDRSTVHGRLLLLLKRARKRARVDGREWDIGVADIHMPTHCPVLGIPLSTVPNGPWANRYSLDRSDNSKGYVKGNVRVISYRANTLKNNATGAELRAVADYVESLEKFEELLA